MVTIATGRPCIRISKDTAMVGDGGESGEKYGGNGTGAGDVLQGNCEVDVFLWEWELGGDEGHSKSTIVVP